MTRWKRSTRAGWIMISHSTVESPDLGHISPRLDWIFKYPVVLVSKPASHVITNLLHLPVLERRQCRNKNNHHPPPVARTPPCLTRFDLSFPPWPWLSQPSKKPPATLASPSWVLRYS